MKKELKQEENVCKTEGLGIEKRCGKGEETQQMEEKSEKFQDWESQVKEYSIKKWELKQEENV